MTQMLQMGCCAASWRSAAATGSRRCQALCLMQPHSGLPALPPSASHPPDPLSAWAPALPQELALPLDLLDLPLWPCPHPPLPLQAA